MMNPHSAADGENPAEPQDNLKKKTGPKTAAGKNAVRLNGYRHGLTGQELIVQPHEQEAYNRIADGFRARFQAADSLEEQIVQKIIDDNWRMNLCAAIDNNMLNYKSVQEPRHAANDRLDAIACRVEAWIRNADNYEKLGRHETRISRRFFRMLAELRLLQEGRRALERQAQLAQAEVQKEDNAEAQTQAIGLPLPERQLTHSAGFTANLELLCKNISGETEARATGPYPQSTEAIPPVQSASQPTETPVFPGGGID